MQINDIYEELKERKLCRSGHDFSKNYLGKHSSYLSVLKVRGDNPSIEVWTMLSYALQIRAQILAESKNDIVQLTAQRLSALQQEVAANIMQECTARSQ